MAVTDAGHQRSRTVTGVVVLPAGEGPAEAATLTVVVEDVSRADDLATAVAEHRRHQVPLPGGEARVPFSLDVPEELIDGRARYSVRVHVDMSGSGDLSDGDYISTQSIPVLTQGAGDDVIVPVQLV